MIPQINMIITHRCNLFCKHCYMNAGIDSTENSEEILTKAKKIINNAKDMGVEKIMITGGECTTSVNLIPILKYITEKNIRATLFTNGFIFNKDVLEYVNDYCLSVDGLEKYHNEIRGNEKSFHNVINTIKKLIKNKKTVTVQISVTDNNFKSIEECVIYLYELGVRKINLSCILNKGRAITNNIKSTYNINNLNKLVEKIYEKTGYNLIIHTNIFSKNDIDYYLKPGGIKFPLWVDLISNKYYMVSEKLGSSISKFELKEINKLEKKINNLSKKIKSIDNVIIEEEIVSGVK